jgi:D-alanine-D-alanine ligase-like ATP-grasp enzyme
MKFSDYEYYDIILKKIKKVLKDIHNHLNKFLDIDSEYLSEFKLFGFDFIVSEDFNIYLLEINKIPNYISKKNSVEIKELKKKLYKSISQKFIKDVFLDIHDRNDNFIKIN